MRLLPTWAARMRRVFPWASFKSTSICMSIRISVRIKIRTDVTVPGPLFHLTKWCPKKRKGCTHKMNPTLLSTRYLPRLTPTMAAQRRVNKMKMSILPRVFDKCFHTHARTQNYLKYLCSPRKRPPTFECGWT